MTGDTTRPKTGRGEAARERDRASEAREERLAREARALRANLLKRKQQRLRPAGADRPVSDDGVTPR